MIKVKDLMSHQLYTLNPTHTLRHAQELMVTKHIRHVPILNEQGEFMGIVTKHDVLRYAMSALADIDERERREIESSIPLIEVMVTQVTVAQEETNLLEAAQYMLAQKHGCLPVFKEDRLIGILTEADFVKLAIHLMEQLDDYEVQQETQLN